MLDQATGLAHRAFDGRRRRKAEPGSFGTAIQTLCVNRTRTSVLRYAIGSPGAREPGSLEDFVVIALQFSLVTAAMLLAYFELQKLAKLVFAGALLLAIFWLGFHATSPLNIQL